MPRVAAVSPEQARDLVEHFGGIRPAARATGLNYNSLWRMTCLEHARAIDRAVTRRRLATPEGRERHLAAVRRYYDRMPGLVYSRKLLANRRRAALKRMAERETRRHDGPL